MTAVTVDAHQHYWAVETFDYGWSRAGLSSLERTCLPTDLEPELGLAGIQRTISVQVLPSLDETRWLLALADRYPSIAGVVGWVDLTAISDEVANTVEDLRSHPRFVGIRHPVQDEADDEWLIREPVLRGLAVLEELAVPFDLLLRERHLPCVPLLSERLPNLNMVIDHLAKPRIRDRVIEPWRTDLRSAAANPRVWCKLSGLVTEAGPLWQASDLAPYIETALGAFGSDRLMYGSDWPVSTLAASYQQVSGALRHVLGTMERGAMERIFGGSASEFYRLA